MVPKEQRVEFHSYRPGWGCITFGDYETMRAQVAGTQPRSPGGLPAMYELSRREKDLIDAKRQEIEAWLIEREYPADLISASSSWAHMRARLFLKGRMAVLNFEGNEVSGMFLAMESADALFEFKMRWL